MCVVVLCWIRLEDLYYKRIKKYIYKIIKSTHTQKKSTINRNNTNNIYNILLSYTYQENQIEEVQLIYWIYVDKNRI